MAEFSSPSKSDSRNPRGNKKAIVCPYFLKGNCLFGDYCFNIHPKSVPETSEDDQLDCGICLEAVLGKETPSERQFALLENCDHVFCIECIRNWRRARNPQANGRALTCPTCRTPFSTFAASEHFVSDSAEKVKLINHAKKKCSDSIVNESSGCPFGCSQLNMPYRCPYCDYQPRRAASNPTEYGRQRQYRSFGFYGDGEPLRVPPLGSLRSPRLLFPNLYTGSCLRHIPVNSLYSFNSHHP